MSSRLNRAVVLTLACGAWGWGACGPARGQTFNIIESWSTLHNPNGPWSYGWSPTAAGPFNLFPAFVTGEWQRPLNAYPEVALLNSQLTLASGSGSGPGIEYGVIRWSPPGACLVSYSFTIIGYWDVPLVDGDVHIRTESTELFTGVLPTSINIPLTPAGQAVLGGGEHLDIRLGAGANLSGDWDRAVVLGNIILCVGALPVAPASACPGNPASFSVTPIGLGSSPYQFQWQIETAPGTWSNLGAAALSLPCGGAASADAATTASTSITVSPCPGQTQYRVRCAVSSSCGGVDSDPTTLTINTADFDGDGDIGTDADIEAFFACLAGNCCATCGSADFDGDGDIGTDADIESFFRVLAGGSC